MFQTSAPSLRLSLRALARLLAYPDEDVCAQMPALAEVQIGRAHV